MRTLLPINLEALLRQRAIEDERVEYKAGWNPESAFLPIFASYTVDGRTIFVVWGLTPQVTPQVERLLAVTDGELLRDELQERLGIEDRKYFRTDFLAPAMEAGLLEMTIPDKPRSSKQRYRLTDLGRKMQADGKRLR